MQRLKWRPLADRRKDARLVMLYKIDRELIVINKENRLIPPGRKTRQAHNRSFQIPSSRIDTKKMSFFPRTVRDWNLLAPDIVELVTPETFKARNVDYRRGHWYALLFVFSFFFCISFFLYSFISSFFSIVTFLGWIRLQTT